MEKFSLVQKIIIWSIPVLFAVTLHEVAHGWVASRLGDKTAQKLGRLTINPLKHMDPIGTVILPILCLSVGNMLFGWAKPVPVDWRNLKNPQKDTALVAIAGPISNFLMCIIWALVTKLGFMLVKAGFSQAVFFIYMGYAGIQINIVLMILNIIPIPPLDGSRVLSSFLPIKLARAYNSIEPYGMLILMVLMFSNILSIFLTPACHWFQILIVEVFAL